jgi:hypothetical protein
MLVTQLVGRNAGEKVDMSFDAVVGAYRAGTVKVPQESVELVKKVAFPEPDTGERVPLVTPVADVVAPEKRRGGWPLGKPRGPRVRPEVES